MGILFKLFALDLTDVIKQLSKLQNMSKPAILIFLLAIAIYTVGAQPKTSPAGNYFPSRWEWQHQSAVFMGLDSVKLQEAIRFARDNESKAPRDMELAQ